jgi:hypothetical protein
VNLVLSNHAYGRDADTGSADPAQAVSGDYIVSLGSCGGIRGTIAYSYDQTGTNPTTGIEDDYSESGTFNVKFAASAFPILGAGYTDDGSGWTIRSKETIDDTDTAGCRTLTTIDGGGTGNTPATDPTNQATIGLQLYDPGNPSKFASVAGFSFASFFTGTSFTQFSGPSDSCANDSNTTETTLGAPTGNEQCVPTGAISQIFGPEPFYGVYTQTSTYRYWDFACTANLSVHNDGIVGTLSVYGKLYLLDP